MFKAMVGWEEKVQELQRQRHKLDNVALRWKNQAILVALNTWQSQWAEGKRLKGAALKVAKRWTQQGTGHE
jgi:hypothetical protein